MTADYVITINNVLKTTRPGCHIKPMIFKTYTVQKLCVGSHIKHYLSLTKSLRGNNKQMFISYFKPHLPVGTNSLSRWIKIFLFKAGIDTFSAHSTRSATCSKLKTCLPIDSIMKYIGWSNAETMAKFYDKPIEKPLNINTTLLDNKHT
jgi:integrase